MSVLADKIRQCRVSKGWSQEVLARHIGVSHNTVQRWEAGKTNPSPLAMEKLQQILDDVLEGEQLRMLTNE
ncbi:MAG: helix-turn-helix transcriptional regulator [Dehalococcoidales bacterium]